MNIRTAIDQALLVAKANQPVLLLGPPGVGKSALPQTVAALMGLPYREIRAAEFEAVDFRGGMFLDIENETTRWLTADMWPNEACVLNFDEITQAPMEMTSPLLKIFLGGSLGDYNLPEGTILFATGNRIEDRAGCSRLSSALRERCVVLNITCDAQSWMEWYRENSPHSGVMEYISQFPDLLHVWDAKLDENQPTPRNWTRLGEVLAHTDHEEVVAGIIGPEPAKAFCKWLRNHVPVPEVAEVVAGEKPAPEELPLMKAWTDKLVDAFVTQDKSRKDIAPLIKALNKTYQVMTLRGIAKRNKRLLTTAHLKPIVQENQAAILQAAKA